jgi:hypothetical protein
VAASATATAAADGIKEEEKNDDEADVDGQARQLSNA